MKLYIGGAFQGQYELAVSENPDAVILKDFHETVYAAVLKGYDPCSFAANVFTEHPQAIIVANEVGSGIVPVSAEDRAYREAIGKALCIIAQNSDSVTRVVCGIGMRIK